MSGKEAFIAKAPLKEERTRIIKKPTVTISAM